MLNFAVKFPLRPIFRGCLNLSSTTVHNESFVTYAWMKMCIFIEKLSCVSTIASKWPKFQRFFYISDTEIRAKTYFFLSTLQQRDLNRRRANRFCWVNKIIFKRKHAFSFIKKLHSNTILSEWCNFQWFFIPPVL